jgi:hypothetical protein
LTHGLIVGLVSGIILSLFIDLVELPNSEFTASLSRYGRSGFIAVVIVGNLLLGLAASAISGFYMERYDIRRLEGTDKNRLKWERVVVTGLVISSLTAIFFLLQGEMQLALAWGAAEATVYVAVARYIHGQSYDHDIRVVESISWSWRHAIEGFFVGLALGVAAILIGKQLGGDISFKIPSVFILGAILLMGMRGRRLEEKSRPNEGIILSLRNGFIAALPLGIILGAQVWIYYDSWSAGLTTAVIMVLIVFSLFGGSTVTKHLLVRVILRREDSNPWRYARFLNHTSRLVFLRKVGGGYIFLHRYLQDYFAGLPAAHPKQPQREESQASWFAQDTQPDISP